MYYARVLLAGLVISTGLCLFQTQCSGQGSAFGYGGQLKQSGTALTGYYDLRFSLFEFDTNGTAIAVTTNSAVSVYGGVFHVPVDFGTGVFDGHSYWLQIDVRTNGASAFSTLSPRQSILPMPYSTYAESAASLTSGALSQSATLSTNSSIVVESPSGSTNTTGSITLSNLLRTIQVLQSINLTNFGNWANSGSITNAGSIWSGGDIVNTNNGDLYLHSQRSLYWVNTNGGTSGKIWFNEAHPNELQIDTPKSISLNLGFDGQQNGVLQLGTSNPTHEYLLAQYDTHASAGNPLGYSKYFGFGCSYWNGTSEIDHHFGFRHEALDNAGNSQLTIYSFLKGWYQAFSDPGNISVGAFGTNTFYYTSVEATNTIKAGKVIQVGAASTTGNGANNSQFQSSWGGYGANPNLVLGGDFNADARTPNVDKSAGIGFQPYDNTTPVIFVIHYTAGGNVLSGNVARIGGGTGTAQGLNGVEFYASTNRGDPGSATPVFWYDANGLGIGDSGATRIKKVISATATLSFPSVAAQTSADLAVGCTGAVAGDLADVGPPAAVLTNNVSFTAYVASNDFVNVRLNNYGTTAKNIPSGMFRVMVTRF